MTMYARHEKEIVGQGGSFGVREATIGIALPQHFHPFSQDTGAGTELLRLCFSLSRSDKRGTWDAQAGDGRADQLAGGWAL